MLVEEIFPAVIGAKDKLLRRMIQAAAPLRVSRQQLDELVGALPVRLLNAPCFLDRLTGHWRYEFGLPLHLNATHKLLWGTHMWLPVSTLLTVLLRAHARLTPLQYADYGRRLANGDKHREYLAEMAPVMRMEPSTRTTFEVPGLGSGNRTVDWHIEPPGGRPILCDVKSRVFDLLHQMDQPLGGPEAPPPDHAVPLLFRSIESKFLSADPNARLQGAWIATDIKQEESQLEASFRALDAGRVHFAVLGDFEPDAHVLVRRAEDLEYIRRVFALLPSTRFTFTCASE